MRGIDLLAYTALFGGYVVVLHTIPGPWKNWSKGQVIDWWTLTHIAWGIIGERMHQSIGQQVALASANEVIEMLARKHAPHLTWGSHESPANIIADIAANALGWYISRKIKR